MVYNVFDFGGHITKMFERHPDWTFRQLANCLYWQPTARKDLRIEVSKFLTAHNGMQVVYTPEAMGVDVTGTMRNVGIELEWPPKTVTYQIAIAGYLAVLNTRPGNQPQEVQK